MQVIDGNCFDSLSERSVDDVHAGAAQVEGSLQHGRVMLGQEVVPGLVGKVLFVFLERNLKK